MRLEASTRSSSLTSTKPRRTHVCSIICFVVELMQRLRPEFSNRCAIKGTVCRPNSTHSTRGSSLVPLLVSTVLHCPGPIHVLFTVHLDFPQEDEYEDRVFATEAANYQAQSDYTHESQTLAILNQADGSLQTCLDYMNRAKEWSTHSSAAFLLFVPSRPS
jgi:hypothetical protein